MRRRKIVMNSDLISVIIPVYNGEKYLERCIDSLLTQTHSELEIICVLNGCSDNSESILKEYCRKNENIIYCESEPGVCAARNLGLKKITGNWFAFVDADDWLEPNYFEVLLENAICNNASLSACMFFRDYEYKICRESNNNVMCLDSPHQCIHNYICSVPYSMNGMIWNKLYRTEMFGDITFDENLRVNEDCMYTFYVTSKCNRACITSARLYHWFQRDDSACHEKKKTADFSAANVFIRLLEETESLNDSGVSFSLKYNYVGNVINTLIWASRPRGEEVKVAKLRCKKWKKEIWNNMSKKNKMKYYLAMLK